MPSPQFESVLRAVAAGGRETHEERMLSHAHANAPLQQRTLRDLPPPSPQKAKSAIVISAGPSLSRRNSIQRIRDSGYTGVVIAVDASLAACLRNGLIPDYVLTLDPHPTRIVRWFGDPDWDKHAANDDYFLRQDLDQEFRDNAARRNAETIGLVDRYGSQLTVLVASCSPPNAVQRLATAGCDMFWWNPLVDNPHEPESISRNLYDINRAPSMNTGGNVGTSAWVFAVSILKLPEVGLVGMDMGYYNDTPHEQTQLYYEYISHLGSSDDIESCFHEVVYPTTGETHYTDPTYYWYARNFIELNKRSTAKTLNCTEGGALVDPTIECVSLDAFLANHR